MPSTAPTEPAADADAPRHPPHGRSASSHVAGAIPRWRAWIAGAALLAGGALACGPDPAAIQADVDQLIATFTPLPPGTPSGELGTNKTRRQALLEQLRGGQAELGAACQLALQAGASPEAAPLPRDVLHALLDVYAHTAPPEESAAELVRLFEEYQEDLHLRRKAAELLADVAPERAVVVLGGVLERPVPGKTYPNYELLVQPYVRACTATGQDPVDVLTQVATGILYQSSARHVACELLGEYPDARSWHALDHVLRQSTGNQYLRVKAAQALVEAAPEERCRIFEEVLSRESMPNVAQVLQNLIEKHCR